MDDAPGPDRPWRRPGAAAYARERLRGIRRPPVTVTDVPDGLLTVDHDVPDACAVHDHGPGLPPGTEKAIFDKFYRAPGTPAGGTGLGLAIAQGLMRALGGTIHARNHPGGGAEFELEVPVTTQPDETLLQSCAEPSPAQHGTDARAHYR